MARISVSGPRALSAAVTVGLVTLAVWNLSTKSPAQDSPPDHLVVPNKAMDMTKHQKDMFRSAKWEVANNDWDQRLKPQIRYSPIGQDAIIQGDIVIGKLADIHERKLYGWSEEVLQLEDLDSLGLTPAQKNVLLAVKNIEWSDDFKAAAKRRERSKALRIIADLMKFESQGKTLKDYPEKEITALKGQGSPNVAMAMVQVGSQYRWPNGVIPYVIDGNVPDSQIILDAIAQWHTQTDRIFLRPKVDSDTDYVRFVLGDGCSSRIGRIGGEQQITLNGGCMTPQIIHEIGHSVGLWHEQCRNDRDNYLVIQDENVQPDMLQNFDIAGAEGQDVGPFDFSSIMLYPNWAFSGNGLPTVVSRFPGIGSNWGVGSPNITQLSIGDLDGVNWMYSRASNPPNPIHPAGTAPATPPTFAPAAPPQLVPVPGLQSQGTKVVPPLPPPTR